MHRGEPSAGGNQHLRKYPRGPSEGHLPWNKGSDWGQTNDLHIHAGLSFKEDFKSNFLPQGDEAAVSQTLTSDLLKTETDEFKKCLLFGQSVEALCFKVSV